MDIKNRVNTPKKIYKNSININRTMITLLARENKRYFLIIKGTININQCNHSNKILK